MKQLIGLDNLIREENETKYAPDIHLSSEIMRTFSINNFGIWNCDHPQYLNDEIPLSANFIDDTNNSISLRGIAVVYGGINGISQFSSPHIRIIPGKQNMIWSIMDSSFYYFTYKDFEQTGINRDTKAFTFRLRRSKKIIASYDEIREMVGNL